MKYSIVRYICETIRDKNNLMISGYHVGRYPLSYTFEECIEEFCDKVGWDFIRATQEYQFPSNRVIGCISFQRPKYSSTLRTLKAHWLNHPSRRNDA